MNKHEISFIRMAAFFKIMETKPEKFILDQITRTLFSEVISHSFFQAN